MKLFFEKVHRYINVFIDLAHILNYEVVDNVKDADIVFTTLANSEKYKDKITIIILHGGNQCQKVSKSIKKLNVIVKHKKDYDSICKDHNTFSFIGAYHKEIGDIPLPKYDNYITIDSYIGAYKNRAPNEYEKFIYIKKHLTNVNLWGFANDDSENGIQTNYINDLNKMKKSKFTLHLKKGYFCNAISRSLSVGTPILMDKDTYYCNSGYPEIITKGIFVGDLDDIIEFVNNISDDRYLKMRDDAFNVARKFRYYSENDIRKSQFKNYIQGLK